MTRFGGYASRAIARTCGVARIAGDIDPVAATALGTQYTTAWYMAMEMVRLHPNDYVLIDSAAGGVGTALVHIAKHCGCIVFGTTGSPGKLHHLASLGVDYPMCTATGNCEKEILRLSKWRGVDVIFDACGGSSVRRGFALLASGGRIVCYGASTLCGSWRPFRVAGTLISFGIVHPVSLLLQSKGIIGVNMLRVADERPDIIGRCFSRVVRLAQHGTLRPPVGPVFSFGEIARAHQMLESRRSIGKTALRWREGRSVEHRSCVRRSTVALPDG